MIRRITLTVAAISFAAAPLAAQTRQPVRAASATLAKGVVSGTSGAVRQPVPASEAAPAEGSDLFLALSPLLLLAVAAAVVAAVAAVVESGSPG